MSSLSLTPYFILMGISWPVKERKDGEKNLKIWTTACFLVDAKLQFTFASVTCERTLCIPVWFCWQAKIFAVVHCSQGFTGFLHLQDLPARIKPLFQQSQLPQPHTQLPSAVAGSHWDTSQAQTLPVLPVTSEEVKMKRQTFFSAQPTDFLRLLLSPVATKAFPEQPQYCSSTGMCYTQTAWISPG